MTRSKIHALAAGLLVAALSSAACRATLPEQGSADNTLYRERCGTCHDPYHPGLMTEAMWKIMYARMEIEIETQGFPRITAEERDRLLKYLARNAGQN
ncbi:MAG: cytochrome C [Candidatus Binatia bacterium]